MNTFADVVIIGAGFAGASTAYYLSRAGIRDVLILEQERTPGSHASGLNAGIIRQIIPDPSLLPFIREGAGFIRKLPEEWAIHPEFKPCGVLLLGTGHSWEKLKTAVATAADAGVAAESLAPSEARRKASILEDVSFDGAAWCATDGVVDIHSLLQGYLRQAEIGGARILTSTKVTGFRTRHHRVEGVLTESGTIQADLVVNAAGAWSGELARTAGAFPVPVYPYRRHLVATGFLDWVDPSWPVVWNLSDEHYFRPESGGLLLSPCDASKHPPGIPQADPEAALWLHKKLESCPRLKNISVKKTWACLRTLADDGRFVIGRDPYLEGFFWVSGLGGHGVTSSAAVGRMAADLILMDQKELKEFSPSRFASF